MTMDTAQQAADDLQGIQGADAERRYGIDRRHFVLGRGGHVTKRQNVC
jgi:hypothetical protein